MRKASVAGLQFASAAQAFAVVRFVALAVGPRVNRLMIVQVVGLTLFAGVLTERLITPFLMAIEESVHFRLVVLLCISLAFVTSSAVLSRTLLPPAIASLRRQPLRVVNPGFALMPWAMILSWPFAFILWIGGSDQTVAICTGWLASAVAVASLACRSRHWQVIAILSGSLIVVLVAATAQTVLVFVVAPLVLVTPLFIGYISRTFTAYHRNQRTTAARADNSILQALLHIDYQVLAMSWRQWLPSIMQPLAGVAFMAIVWLNENCRDECQDNGSLIVVSLAVLSSAAILSSLVTIWGARVIAPDRVVPTRLRLASLFLVASTPPALMAFLLLPLSGYSSSFLQVSIVAAVALLVSLWNPDRASKVGLAALCLFPCTTIFLMLEWWSRSIVMIVVLVILLIAIDWRGKLLRRRLQRAWRGASAL
ncbi:MAG: hypothetical protein V3U76_17765 [Granulosicoccus sp.]